MAPTDRITVLPHCLADNGNRWMLSWRLAWSFACTRHHTLLGLRAPERGGAPACTFPLAEADTVPLDPDGPVLRAQHRVNTTITALLAARGTGADLAPLQQIPDDLHAAARATLAALRTSTRTTRTHHGDHPQPV